MCYARNISQALAKASALLSAVTDNPRLESELLLAHVLQCSRVYLRAYPEDALSEVQARRYTSDVERRVHGEPLPYITGTIEFYGMLFGVTPDVLIPRPETEMLVELASAWLAARRDSVVLDVGTGSGCIAVALAHHAKCRHIYATDISLAALRVAQQNAAQHSVLDKIRFVNCDLIHPIHGPVDVIVSNPPYIAEYEWPEIPRSVHCEPHMALFAGEDGLQIVKRLLHQARARLNADGLMLVEIGAQQGDAALAIAKAAFPNASLQILRDLAGKDRVIRIQCGATGP